MRAITAALMLGMLLAGGATAGDLSDPVWTKAPDRSDWAKAYPAQAAQSGVSGSAQVRCAATAAGQLEKCAVVAETPVGQGFGAAALSLMGGMELRATSESGQLITGKSVLVPVKFTPDLFKPTVITNPDWMKKPNLDNFAQMWPAAARGREGKAAVTCVVSQRGLLDKCKIASESPADAGFGDAALMMTQSFLMRPMTRDGEPVGGAEVTVPIRFLGGGGYNGPTFRVLREAPWGVTPTVAQMQAAFPKAAIGRSPSGHVVLRCGLERSGSLTNCDVLTEEPKGEGFASAARSLAKDFRVLTDPKVDKVGDILVNVPIDLRDPGRPSPPIEVFDPRWLKSPDPAKAASLFPAAAAKAGLKEGVGLVECQVTHSGTLTGCAVVSENPPGLGFGDAALAVAGVVQMNPWTSQGSPVDGAKIRLPVRLKLPDEPAPAAAKP